MLINVVLIDDEYWGLASIKKSFPWAQYGFNVAQEFENPFEAVEYIIREKPEVIFTDIRMPGISGIDLVKIVRDKGIESEIVIISGFAEFSYAQEAMRYGVFDYILKPFSLEDAEKLLIRLKQHIDEKIMSDVKSANNISITEFGNELKSNFSHILQYIADHSHEQISSRDISEKFYISMSYFCELFNKICGKTFSEYLTDVRMNKAMQLLKRGNITVNAVSLKCGYTDYYYFNKVFKKYYGITPYQYMKNGGMKND